MTHELYLGRVASTFETLLLTRPVKELSSEVLGWIDSGLVVRTVRGSKMRTLESLLDEVSAALQFPLYFGGNRDAFEECLEELELLPGSNAIVLVITDPESVLADEAASTFRWFAHSLKQAAKVWSEPIELGEWWDRPARPFHVVLSREPNGPVDWVTRWTDAGLDLAQRSDGVV